MDGRKKYLVEKCHWLQKALQMKCSDDAKPEETRHINRWLADNCFGDYYTRNGLDYTQREMITFCFLAAQ